MKRTLFIGVFGAIVLLPFLCGGSAAQVDQGGFLSLTPKGTTTNFHYAEPNELTIVVSLLGAVQRPGRYEISRTIDLMNLLSLAGGPIEKADLADVRIRRYVKTGEKTEKRELKVDISDFSKIQDGSLELQQGDFVSVGYSAASVQDVLSYLATAAVVTTAVITVVNQVKSSK